MWFAALVLAVPVVAAPPAEDADRILLWTQNDKWGADGKPRPEHLIVHFKPDGSDAKRVAFPDGVTVPGLYDQPAILTPTHDRLIYAWGKTRFERERILTVVSLDRVEDPFVLKEYTIEHLLPDPVVAADGSVSVFFH